MVLDVKKIELVVEGLEERIGGRRLPGAAPQPGIIQAKRRQLSRGMALPVPKILGGRVGAGFGVDGDVVIVKAAQADLGAQPLLPGPRRDYGVSYTFRRARESRTRQDFQRLLDFDNSLFR